MNDIIQLTFFSVSSFAIALAGVVFFLFVFFLKDKSQQTTHMAIILLALGVFHVFYLFSSSVYHPVGAFHRVGTVLLALIAAPHMVYLYALLLESYSENVKKVGKIIFYSMYGIIAVVVLIFLIYVLSVDRLYRFSGHYWDFDADLVSKQIGGLILVFFIIFTLFASWSLYQKYKYTKKINYSYLLILLMLILLTIPAGIFNILSRDGLLPREVYQLVIVTTSIVGMFVIVIMYFNTSHEKTQIIHRIIAISLVTFMIVIQFLVQNNIEKKNIFYDQLKLKDMQIYINTQKKPHDLKYFGYYDFNKNQYKPMISGKNDTLLFSQQEAVEWKNARIRSLLLELETDGSQNISDPLNELLRNAHPEFLAYKRFVGHLIQRKKNNINIKNILEEIDSKKLKITYIKKKIEKIPEKNFAKDVASVLSMKDKLLQPFIDTIQRLAIDRKKTKSEILLYLQPFIPPHERKYRGQIFYTPGDELHEHFVSFNHMDTQSDRLYEAGFSYLNYRRQMHLISFDFMTAICLFTLFVLLGFRLFFSNALINPIRRVRQGLEEFHKGNLNHRIDIQVEDEIGFLGRSFNSMGESLKDAHEKLQDYAEGLEKKVEERTAELNNTLKKVMLLKNQQDGDYFLTHLLTNPLSSNRVHSKKIRVDFLIRQRKRFSFRNYVGKDLGGDLNIADEIKLNNKTYVVFINADGMGKSMQGAGGALVCGCVFRSIIERTQKVKLVKKQPPEQWLKSTFLELHYIFQGFSGNMLVSCIFGLVEANTGMVYYLNAEHPKMSLYRDNKAKFIDNEPFLGKLGTLDIDENITIKTFKMRHNDVLLFGSDGKDELIIGKTEGGGRVINEDEDLFLENIEKGNGDLKQIFKETARKGKIMDDISLIKIGYESSEETLSDLFSQGRELNTLFTSLEKNLKEGNTDTALGQLKEIQRSDNKMRLPSKEFGIAMINLKQYEDAFQELERYLDYAPQDNYALYTLAFAAKKLKKILYSIHLSERLYLRNQSHEKNLIQLIQLRIAQKDNKRATRLLGELENLNPLHPKIKKFKSILSP